MEGDNMIKINRNELYNEIAQIAQKDRDYFMYGKPSQIGFIENLLAHFNVEYEKVNANSQTMHINNLLKVDEFIKNAPETQLYELEEYIKKQKFFC